MVTPSLHTIGAPHFFWIRTDFERGPKVTRTTSAGCSRAAEDLLASRRAEYHLFVRWQGGPRPGLLDLHQHPAGRALLFVR